MRSCKDIHRVHSCRQMRYRSHEEPVLDGVGLADEAASGLIWPSLIHDGVLDSQIQLVAAPRKCKCLSLDFVPRRQGPTLDHCCASPPTLGFHGRGKGSLHYQSRCIGSPDHQDDSWSPRGPRPYSMTAGKEPPPGIVQVVGRHKRLDGAFTNVKAREAARGARRPSFWKGHRGHCQNRQIRCRASALLFVFLERFCGGPCFLPFLQWPPPKTADGGNVARARFDLDAPIRTPDTAVLGDTRNGLRRASTPRCLYISLRLRYARFC